MRHPERTARLIRAWQTVTEADMECNRSKRLARLAKAHAGCWECGAPAAMLVTEPDPGMRLMTDRVRCTRCDEIQETD